MMLDTPQEIYDYFAELAVTFPAPKWDLAVNAAQLWMSYHAAPHPQPELLHAVIEAIFAYRQAGSGFLSFWYVILHAIAQLPPAMQISLWQTIYTTPPQESSPLKDQEFTQRLLTGWKQLITEPQDAPLDSDQIRHLAQRCGATFHLERESMALVNAVDTWIERRLTTPKLLHLLLEQLARSDRVPPDLAS